MLSEYWIISAPGDKTCQQTFDTMNNLTSKQHNLCNNYKFHIPDLKVGTLDQLVGLSDDLGKLDTYVEQITRKVANYLNEVLEDQRDKLHENLQANNTNLPQYLTRFQWDMAKYPIKQSLRNIADIISKQIGQIDGDLKTKSQAYNNLKGNLQNLEKKKSGSLLTRNLADLVKKEHFILDSEYLTTLLVIVPKAMANDWLANYEKITDMIVPRSSQLIKEDPDYCLFNVTLFKKVAEEFKLHARERKFIVRDFVYNEEELAAGKNEITKLMTDKKKQFGPLVRWLKVNFSEAFCALIHVKALRVFVESVLRYGLPVNFQAILIEPNKKSVKRLRDVLNQLYGHLDGAAAGGHVSSADNVDIPGLGFGQSEYFPYVFYKVNIEMVEQPKV
ncbi:V-type proton ATPase subunit C isoform X4 [Drosophila tropicalis]|uniref:V-type proton ATPase subunit C isoform X1 n=1 Tax=Drosophila willistoni TaxID=7260 RepID=UPI000732B72D|nr:V-type proton ATPase subunit C isoform X1 [Drosophila willistoni]KRF97872.1 uncharacterized protein Dwil_GK21692, isoform B [Drosophila willistoni]